MTDKMWLGSSWADHHERERLELALDDCLGRIIINHQSPEACCTLYPEIADDLMPLLEFAKLIAANSQIAPSLSFKMQTRRSLLALRENPLRHRAAPPSAAGDRYLRQSLVGLVLVLSVAASIGGLVASDGALPGTPLYSVKRQVESLQLALASDSESQANVDLMVAERRLDETEKLVNIGSMDLADQTIGEYDQHMSTALNSLEHVSDEFRPLIVAKFGEHLAQRHDELEEIEGQARETNKVLLNKALSITERASERVGKIKSMMYQ